MTSRRLQLAGEEGVDNATERFGQALDAQEPAHVARLQGYQGHQCPVCHARRLRRTGTCSVCENCGSSEGCG